MKKFTVSNVIGFVSKVVATIIFVVCLTFGLDIIVTVYSKLTEDSSHSGPLGVGQEVMVVQFVRARLADDVLHARKLIDNTIAYRWDIDFNESGDFNVTAGTLGIVKIESAIDEDACIETRPIAVTLSEGKFKGLTLAFSRNSLRVK